MRRMRRMRRICWCLLIAGLVVASCGCILTESRGDQPSPLAAAASGAATGFTTGGPIGAAVGGVGALIAAIGAAYGARQRNQVKSAEKVIEEIITGVEAVRRLPESTGADTFLRSAMSEPTKAKVRSVKKRLKLSVPDTAQ